MSTTLAPDAAAARTTERRDVGRWLRGGLLALAAAGVLGTAGELAALRHWESAEQLIPWAVLATLAAAIGLLAARPTFGTVWTVRLLGLVACLGGAYGVVDHITANLDAGPLDATYGARWEGMGTAARWWAAASGGVGPSPVLAPAILTQIGLMLLLATLAHPALTARRRARDT